MTKPLPLLIAAFLSCLLFFQCRESPLHDNFMNECDCFIYEREVETEHYSFGKVQSIDTNNASGCAKSQLPDTYLLYYDTSYVTVRNIHPNENHRTIEAFIKQYQSDTTRLTDFAWFSDSIRLTVGRRCDDKADYHYKKYVDWRDIVYATTTQPYIKTKDEVDNTWYNWIR